MGNRKIYEDMEASEREAGNMDGGTALAAGGGALIGSLFGNWFGDGGYGYGRGRNFGGDCCEEGHRVGEVLNRLDFDHTDSKLDRIAGEICCGFGNAKDEKIIALTQRLNAVETKDIIQAAFEKQEAEARQEKILGFVAAINERQVINDVAARDGAINAKLNFLTDKVLSGEKVSEYKKWDVLEDTLGKVVGVVERVSHRVRDIEKFLNGSDLVGSSPTAVPDPPIA